MSADAWIILALIVGIGVGWTAAHATVAQECEKLGRFYVGSRVYECRPASTTPTQVGAGAQEPAP